MGRSLRGQAHHHVADLANIPRVERLVVGRKHEHKLRDEGFDTVTTLRELEKDDLKEIGITKLGHRKAIIKAITTL